MKKKIKFSSAQVIAFGFLLTILIGASILCLPICSTSGEWTSFDDALFTAATSVCVTGLVTVSTAFHWSLFGQTVILLLVQIGGLGIISITSAFLWILHRKITLKDSMLLEDALNLDSIGGIMVFLRKVFLYTFAVEVISFLLYIPVFATDFGAIGIWYSLFHSVSAFCNAGMDLLGDSSLCLYAGHAYLNIVTMLEIILGGIGFVVVFEMLSLANKKRRREIMGGGFFKRLSIHSKIVLVTTAILLLGGAALFFVFEYNNPLTIGNMPLGEKLLASMFQSVTTRTAGFATVPQEALTEESALLSVILMFIGGSPIGTAGGIKTTTFAVLMLSVAATLIGRKYTVVAKRRISDTTVKKATSVFIISVLATLLACMLMFVFVPGESLDVFYEVISALGTVGLTRNFTSTMNLAGKLIITVCMYLGRIGPISIALAFSRKAKDNTVRYAEGKVTVG